MDKITVLPGSMARRIEKTKRRAGEVKPKSESVKQKSKVQLQPEEVQLQPEEIQLQSEEANEKSEEEKKRPEYKRIYCHERQKLKPPEVTKITGITLVGLPPENGQTAETAMVVADAWGGQVLVLYYTQCLRKTKELSNKQNKNRKYKHPMKADNVIVSKVARDVMARSATATSTGLIAYTSTYMGRKHNSVEMCIAKSGQSIAKWGMANSWKPWGIAINNKSQLIITDVLDNSIGVYTHYGRMVMQFGNHGVTMPYEERLNNPRYVTIDSHDRVIVTDYNNKKVKIFDRDGNYLTTLGDDWGPFRLSQPRGVAVDKYDNIFVCDSELDRLMRYTSSGKCMGPLLTYEKGLYNPCVIDIDKNSNRMVIGCNGYRKRNTFNKIKIYDMEYLPWD